MSLRVPHSRTDPLKSLLRMERFPHIWCPGCGIGVVVKCFVEAALQSGIPVEKHVVVSGIGCTSRAPGYIKVDGFHVIHGRAIPFAIGLKTARPDLEVTVIAGDGDLLAIGGNHFLHATRRNDDINVILVNNFIYGMTGGQYGPTTLEGALTTTSPYGFVEGAFNVPYLASALGANFVARWTPLHTKELTNTMLEMFKVDGFAIIEVVSPCLIYGELNNMPPLDMMKWLKDNTIIDHNADLSKIDVNFKKPLVLGNFVRRYRPSHQTRLKELVKKVVGGG
ncbi:MAG: thiamine pyrophosphate-dependent enzyme [Thermoprotei archaeon]|nr:thiamine pyrophosphate-dependent enzyme [Thermoprotei archaeon]